MLWRWTGGDIIRLTLLLQALALAMACAVRTEPADPFAGEPTRENRWAAILNINGESTPLTAIILTRADFDGRVRLVIVSSFGAALDDCRLSPEKTVCRPAVPGAAVLTDKVTLAIKDIMDSSIKLNILDMAAQKTELKKPDWEAEAGLGKINYRRLTEPRWELVMNRLETR